MTQPDHSRATWRKSAIALFALAVLALSAGSAAAQVPATCPAELGTADLVDNDFSVSFCALCEVGTLSIVVENPLNTAGSLDLSHIVVREDLGSSGLTYVPGTTNFQTSNVAAPAVVEPVVTGANGQLLTWTLPPVFSLDERPGGPGNRAQLRITFQVRRHASLGPEGLVSANRSIAASLTVEPSCAPGETYSQSDGSGTLALREPVPNIQKLGRNVDAGQASSSYSDPVFAHENDDVIWRIRVRNDGQANLQDFRFDDSIVPGNFEIHHVCSSEASATSAANGGSPGACVALADTTDIFNFDVAAAFGGGASPYIVATPGSSRYYYLVGKVTDSCSNRVNTVSDVAWGCQSQPPVGGISTTSTGITPGDAATLRTQSAPSTLDVDVALTGVNTAQPMGARGIVTITIANRTGGTVVGADGIELRNLLPTQYVIDTTFAPTLVMAPAYGNAYPGMIDTLTWTNPVPGSVPPVPGDPALPLGNTSLDFILTSSTVHPNFADQLNMIRHGDVVTIRLRTVLIAPQYYDRTANLDVRVEAPASDPPGTDPTASFAISDRAEIWFEEFCTGNETHLVIDENSQARPEDLDVDIVGGELLFILTSTGDPLPLTVALTNSGGHDASDYQAYVTFGEAMRVQTVAPGCTPTTNPPPLPVWQIPSTLPATAAVYRCQRGVISPGEWELFNFEVVKNTAASFEDDLSFRADVIGEITLSDATPLWFPTPVARADGITDRANDYSLDGVRARVIGYDLFKSQVGVCTENNPPPASPDDEIQIGEQCSFHIESGGWFGFRTPGFTYIAVQNIQVVDQNPDGQGYIASTDPLVASTSAIQGVQLNPPPPALADAYFDWTFNTVVPAERISEKDHWFRVDFTSRLLNDPIDSVAAPNQHAALSSNILGSTFEAVFLNPLTGLEELYGLGPSTVGFPREVHRRVDLTVSEPRLTLVKEVCNETRYGMGPACSNFVPLADDGDAFDTYVYRVTVSNEADALGVTRAPAYDVTVTSVADASDMLFLDPLAGDGLDNDADSLADAGDAAGEGVITDNVVENGVPAQWVASHGHSNALLRIDAGQSVALYYRVDPDDDVAPLQQLTSTVTASYDSLEGASGSQTAPQGANGESGGARQYVSAPAAATIQIIPVEVSPKQITRVSNSALALSGQPQPVSIGEEVEFLLEALIPVAQLRSFVVRDELPAGIRCSEAPVVNLDAPPYAAAGFVPGGSFTPTCTDTEVVWDFGNQTVTQSPRADRRFDFALRFIARVDNAAANQDGLLIQNGGTATATTVGYVDQAGNAVVLSISEASLVVREPVLTLEKTFSVAQVDAADLPRVTVTATNVGTAAAYNLRVLDDLSAVALSYAGDIAGAVPPVVDLVSFGPDRPLFRWSPDAPLAPGETRSFSFAVRVAGTVEPHQILSNTIQADWTSLPGAGTALNSSGVIGASGSATGMRIGSLPNAGDPLNDYEVAASATTQVPPLVIDKLELDPAQVAAIGAHRPFRLVITLPEGITRNVSLSDSLDAGVVSHVLADTAGYDIVYEFEGILSVNGQSPSGAAFSAVPSDGTRGSALWSIGDVVTASEDDLASAAFQPQIRISYFARIDNDLVTDAGDALQNSAQLGYRNGQTGGVEALVDATAAVVAVEPSLSATKLLANVTPGKSAGDPPAFEDVLQYTVTVVNNGTAIANDVNVVDTLPPQLMLEVGFTPTAVIDSAPVVGFVGLPAGSPDGPLRWGNANGDASLDIPPGGFLDLTYRVVVRTPLPDPDVLANRVWIDWTSLDSASAYERTGAGCPTTTPPDDYCFGPAVASGTAEPVAPPAAALKQNTRTTAAVGENFAYRITIPATPYAFPIYDVRIHDDLAASAAALRFVSVSRVAGSQPWTPVNTGTATSLVLEDTVVGIDIPAGEQIVVEVTVVLEDTPVNSSGLVFTNTASYLYDWVDGDDASQRPGLPGTTAPMTIVGPDALTLDKRGPVQMTMGAPATFTLDAHNTGSGAAFGWTIRDRLPDLAPGGTCAAAPISVTAQIFEADGTTAVSAPLVAGVDFVTSFAGAPDCLFTLSAQTSAAALGADQRLLVSYQTQLDPDTQDGAVLTNVAGATEWFSAEGADRRAYTRTLSDGSIAVVDHEDALTTLSALPRLRFEKTVSNLTVNSSPPVQARPGDVLRYRLEVENLASVPLANFSIVDEIDVLNAAAAFVPGSLQLVTLPAGADASATNSTGGSRGTGVVDVRNLGLPGLGDLVVVEFDVTLAAVLAAGSYVTNQSQLQIGAAIFGHSDDPGVNGPADPLLTGDEDPTRVQIESAPLFQVQKISDDLTADPGVLQAGETLRYTIRVKNVGSDNATDARLRDAIPVGTRYVAGSTTLNGAAVPDLAGGVAPLSAGIALAAPEDPTPGVMRADASPTANNVAVVIFDVVVDANAVDGSVISNQGFVSAVAGGVIDQPSDDPATPLANDPTRDVVGNLPLLFAAKDVAIQVDAGTPGVVDPGDVLRYTITLRNSGAIPATAVSLRDPLPANTRYVADSLWLNGLPVGQPDGGVSPLIAGIPVSSSDLTPPLPAAGAGVVSAGASAVVTFDVQVDAGVSVGTILSNQARVTSAQLPDLLTDGDGNPATGPEPTIVVVGGGQQLAISKTVAVYGGGAALPGAWLEYVVRVVNIGSVAATDVVLRDDLAVPVAGRLALVPGSATLNGSAAGVGVLGSVITADYSTANGPLPPGQAVVLRFLAVIDGSLALGTSVTNVGVVDWNTPTQSANASVSVDVGGMPGVGLLSGALWHDADFDRLQDAGERALAGWSVELLRNGQPVHTALADASGAYVIPGIQPNVATGDAYALRFRAPGASATTASLGRADSSFTNGLQEITDIVVTSGGNLMGLDLPIQPNGVVYDSIQRVPIAGARVSLLNASSGAPLPAACFDDPAQQGQITLRDGHYKFDLNFSSAACPSAASYRIDVSGTAAGYASGLSGIIPPITDASTTPLSVPTCPGSGSDAVPATPQYCEVQAVEFAPPTSVAARAPGTDFHSHIVLDSSQMPGSSQIFNNHLALDPEANAALAISKTTPSANVLLGQLVPYEITLRNQVAVDLLGLDVVDRFPAGFRYVTGSARLDGQPAEPAISGQELVWNDIDVSASTSRTLLLLLGVGAGVGEGEYVNRVQALSGVGAVPLSGVAQATVRVVPDPDFACTDVLGKVFDDIDRDGVQDGGEVGLQGVRLVTPRGLVATTDQHGRFHITCAIVPHPDRGSNMLLKLDDRSLPSGFRLTTRQAQVQRATRGKALRFHYGATLHRVVGLDVADAVFEPGNSQMREQWQPRIPLLLQELQKSPATLRLAYVADVEDEKLVQQRLSAVEKAISKAWDDLDAGPLEIEREIYWRRGTPPGGSLKRMQGFGLGAALDALGLRSGNVTPRDPGQSTERKLSPGEPATLWAKDSEPTQTQAGDRIEAREVRSEKVTTAKLKNVVPPIRFASGVSEIPPSSIARLRSVLAEMQHLDNVRLHLIGHTDDQRLTGELAGAYGDNEGLSRERAGEVAEFVQAALQLPPEAISFSWAGEREPLASNATPEGRAQNRRVEVEVWYDEREQTTAVQDFVVADSIERLKVCRVETVCKMRFIEGHERRARVRNLVAPLAIDDENVRVSDAFVRQVAEVLHDLGDRQNVTLKFVGFTDAAPLTGRSERIYGTHLSLSKAMARRVSLAIQDALDLPSSAVLSDGRGASLPLASNDTPQGRALNRRVEVEFWYDDPLQELPDEPQICPGEAGEAMLTRVYDPPWGVIPNLPVEDGEVVIPSGTAPMLQRALAEVADKPNARLRFVGYTSNEHLDRRTAMVYGDDIGLSAARARRAMDLVRTELALTESQTEHEGRGYLHSSDVVNGGFIQGQTSYVAVQVVYDEPTVQDDYEGVEITPITRELTARDPLSLNLMRITVDGEPIDDPGRGSSDIQRCTDVAFGRSDIQFRFDALETTPRLSVTSDVRAVGTLPASETGSQASGVRFRMYTNYAHFIERSEVRVFERGESRQGVPLAVLEVGADAVAAWQPDPEILAGPVRELEFVLRAYDPEGRFDETAAQTLWLVHADTRDTAGAGDVPDETALLAGYGESELAIHNIDLGGVGTVRVQGGSIPPGHSVWLAGNPIPVDERGQFVAEAVLPAGMHTVEVAVLDDEGNGELFLRDLELQKSDWFYVGMADVTVAGNFTQGDADRLQGENATTDPDSIADGRLAFFVDGRFGDDWRLVASADTREGPVEDLFSNFLDKSPDALFRRMDSDYSYPTFGDDGSVEEMAPSMGKFYARLSQDENHALWGNFKAGYTDNELSLVERGLYGGNLHLQTDATTRFGERRAVLDGFAADPGTIGSREEFRGTGGSLYYLRHRDLLMGSERLRIEVRDKTTGLVLGSVPLSPDADYDIDYIQGRVLLNKPIASTVDDNLLVRSGDSSGDEAWLVVHYEYAPGFDEIDALATGGQAHYWLSDFLKLGATAYGNADDDSGLYGASLVARKNTESWLELQTGWSRGLVSDSLRSDDGGFGFMDTAAPVQGDGNELGYRVDGSLGLGDVIPNAGGQLTLYYQRLEAGYSAPGQIAATDTQQYGGSLDVPLTEALTLTAKADSLVEDMGLESSAQEVDVSYEIFDGWSLATGIRNDDRRDDSPAQAVTQEEGGRTDAVVQTTFDPGSRWRSYAFGQATLRKTEDRDPNRRGGVGGSYRFSDRLLGDAEVSYGDGGPGVRAGTEFQESAETRRYVNYSLDNERAVDGQHARQGRLTSGFRSRISDSASLYQEDRLQHGGGSNGLSRALGMSWSPSEQWTFGADWETGTLVDRRTQAETERNAGGGRVSYRLDPLFVSSGIEYRFDDQEQPDGSRSERTTWLFRNSLRLQLTPDWRLLGKLDHSFSDSSLGEFYDGGYSEGVLGFGYRPVAHDRIDVLAKYTYFYNLPSTDQIDPQGTSAQFLQRSHVGSLDVSYDLTDTWTLGGKYAYRRGEVSLDRENPDFFSNDAHLFILRADWRFAKNWETSLEGRTLYLPDLQDQRSGAVFTVYRHLGKKFKIGLGYNFTDYSDDLTDLSYDRHGVFINLLGTL